MKRLFTLCIFCILSMPCLFAQSGLKMFLNEEGRLYLLPSFKQYIIKMPEIKYEPASLAVTPLLIPEIQLPDSYPQISLTTPDRPMDMNILSGAYSPFFNPYTPLYLRTYPMAFDYFEAYGYQLNENLGFVVSGFQSTWPGAGGINTVNTSIAWSNDKWEVWGGGFAGRYATPYDISPGYMTGISGGVNYEATEWLKLKTWGQYTLYDREGRNNMFLQLDRRHNKTSVGGAMEFKVNENVGFGFGVQYDFNPMRNKWDRSGIFYPVIKSGKSIGISIN